MMPAQVIGGGGEEALAKGGLLLFWLIGAFFITCATGFAALMGIALSGRFRGRNGTGATVVRSLAMLAIAADALCIVVSLVALMATDAGLTAPLLYAIVPAGVACLLSVVWLVRLRPSPAR